MDSFQSEKEVPEEDFEPYFVDVRVSGRKEEPIYEEIPVRFLDNNKAEVLLSPVFCTDVVAGDIATYNKKSHSLSLKKSGPNIALHVIYDNLPEEEVNYLTESIENNLQGRLDSWIPDYALIYTIPKSTLINETTEILDTFAEDHEGVSWYYFDSKRGAAEFDLAPYHYSFVAIFIALLSGGLINLSESDSIPLLGGIGRFLFYFQILFSYYIVTRAFKHRLLAVLLIPLWIGIFVGALLAPVF